MIAENGLALKRAMAGKKARGALRLAFSACACLREHCAYMV
jgi:hypothetical protein